MGAAEATLVFEELGRAAAGGRSSAPSSPPGWRGGETTSAGAGLRVVPPPATPWSVWCPAPWSAPWPWSSTWPADGLMVVGDEEVELVEPRSPRRHPPARPRTPVDVVDDLPGGTARRRPRRGRSPPRRRWPLAAALQVGLAGRGHDHGHRIRPAAHPVRSADRQLPGAEAPAAGLVQVEVARRRAGGGRRGRRRNRRARRNAHRALDAARIVASGAADRFTRACVQVHGGMGHLGARRPPLPEAGAGARRRHRLAGRGGRVARRRA